MHLAELVLASYFHRSAFAEYLVVAICVGGCSKIRSLRLKISSLALPPAVIDKPAGARNRRTPL